MTVDQVKPLIGRRVRIAFDDGDILIGRLASADGGDLNDLVLDVDTVEYSRSGREYDLGSLYRAGLEEVREIRLAPG